MVMIKLNGIDKELYEDRRFLSNLDIYLDGMADNDDLVLVVDGPERSGKSFRIRQIAKYCAQRLGTTFGPKNIHFDLQSYLDFSIESPQYTVCVLDEGRNVLNKKASMSRVNKKFTNYISECAKKRQVHIIAAPAFHDIDKYVTDWRMKFLIHMHKWYEKDEKSESGYKMKRGEYTMYMNDDYLKDSYKYPYRYPRKWETKGRYSNIEVFTAKELEQYEKDKDDNMELKYHSKSAEQELGKREQMWRTRWHGIVDLCINSRGISRGELADASKMELKTFNNNILYFKDSQN